MTAVTLDEFGRPEPPLAGSEVETLLGFRHYQRATLAWKCAGLDDEQLRTRLHPTSMTLARLLKHLARVEDGWFSEVVAEDTMPEPWSSMPWPAAWENCAADTGEELRALCAERVEASRRVVWRSSKPATPLSTHAPGLGRGKGVPRCDGSSCT